MNKRCCWYVEAKTRKSRVYNKAAERQYFLKTGTLCDMILHYRRFFLYNNLHRIIRWIIK